MTWRAKKDAPTDGTPIIVWMIYSTGTLYGARFGELNGQDGWCTFDPLAENGYGGVEFFDDEEDNDFLWIPFPQWELAESLGKALVKAHKDSLKKAAEEPQSEE